MRQGIDYFPFYLELIADRKFRKLRSKYGAVSVLVYLSLLTMIFGDKGYYLHYNEQTRSDVVWEVLNHLRGKNEPSEAEITGIIEGLARDGLFDLPLFRAGVLTSCRIQKVFYRITSTRKNFEMDFSLWLLDEAEMRSISGRSAILEKFLKQENHVVLAEKHTVLTEKHTVLEQRKGKQRKAEERKAEERKEEKEACASRALRKPFGKYGHVLLSREELEKLNKLYGEPMVRQAAELLDEYMEMSGKRYQNCALAIKRWGIDAVKERDGGKKETTGKKSGFHNFAEQSFDYDAIQRTMRARKGGSGDRTDDAKKTEKDKAEV